MIDLFRKYTRNKKLLILGFGREGRSTLRFVRAYFPEIRVGVADRNPNIAAEPADGLTPENLFQGEDYLKAIDQFDVIIKSPGVRLPGAYANSDSKIWLSQTRLFLECYRDQIIGITGTKGKSTTVSLVYHLLKAAGKKAVLVGNIGRPPFDLLKEIDRDTKIVIELSAHQLEHVRHSPRIAILLNLFPEHLDHFGAAEAYFRVKFNIIRFQNNNDILILDEQNSNIKKLLAERSFASRKISIGKPDELFSDDFLNRLLKNSRLEGSHNEKNLLAAAMACKLSGADDQSLGEGLKTFRPLEHRLEYAGTFCGIRFYNDSISTIPESTIEALKTVENTGTLILGGFDRGLYYGELLRFVAESPVGLIIFTGPAGSRMISEFRELHSGRQQIVLVNHFSELPGWMLKTPKGKTCLLSPAASSYDAFKDFEERGRVFKKMAESLGGFCL